MRNFITVGFTIFIVLYLVFAFWGHYRRLTSDI